MPDKPALRPRTSPAILSRLMDYFGIGPYEDLSEEHFNRLSRIQMEPPHWSVPGQSMPALLNLYALAGLTPYSDEPNYSFTARAFPRTAPLSLRQPARQGDIQLPPSEDPMPTPYERIRNAYERQGKSPKDAKTAAAKTYIAKGKRGTRSSRAKSLQKD